METTTIKGRKPREFTPEEIKDIKDIYKRTNKLAPIKKKYKVHRDAIYRVLGIKPEKKNNNNGKIQNLAEKLVETKKRNEETEAVFKAISIGDKVEIKTSRKSETGIVIGKTDFFITVEVKPWQKQTVHFRQLLSEELSIKVLDEFPKDFISSLSDGSWKAKEVGI